MMMMVMMTPARIIPHNTRKYTAPNQSSQPTTYSQPTASLTHTNHRLPNKRHLSVINASVASSKIERERDRGGGGGCVYGEYIASLNGATSLLFSLFTFSLLFLQRSFFSWPATTYFNWEGACQEKEERTALVNHRLSAVLMKSFNIHEMPYSTVKGSFQRTFTAPASRSIQCKPALEEPIISKAGNVYRGGSLTAQPPAKPSLSDLNYCISVFDGILATLSSPTKLSDCPVTIVL